MVTIKALQGVSHVKLEAPKAPTTQPETLGSRQDPPQTGKPLPAADFEQAVQAVEQRVQNLQRRLQFSIDEDSGRTIVKVIDRETDEVIRQIPQEEMIALARRLEASTGLLITDQA